MSARQSGIDRLPFNAVISVKLKNGKIFTGEYFDSTSELDGETGEASITLRSDEDNRLYELFAGEIESVAQTGVYSSSKPA